MGENDERMKRGVKILKKMGRHGLLERQKEDYPDLYQLTTANLFGDIWTRPHLSLRDRQLITIAAGVALARTTGNHSHYHSALQMGITREQLIELIIHVGHYAGWPTSPATSRGCWPVTHEPGQAGSSRRCSTSCVSVRWPPLHGHSRHRLVSRTSSHSYRSRCSWP